MENQIEAIVAKLGGVEKIEEIITKLGGIEDVQRFLSGERILKDSFQIWKKIQIGNHDAHSLYWALRNAHFKIDNDTNQILRKLKISTNVEEIKLVNLSVADLGLNFKKGLYIENIYNQAQDLGLELCPNEVGPQLRLQYKDQPENEILFIGMEPIFEKEYHPYIFSIENRKNISIRFGSPLTFCAPECKFIFKLP